MAVEPGAVATNGDGRSSAGNLAAESCKPLPTRSVSCGGGSGIAGTSCMSWMPVQVSNPIRSHSCTEQPHDTCEDAHAMAAEGSPCERPLPAGVTGSFRGVGRDRGAGTSRRPSASATFKERRGSTVCWEFRRRAVGRGLWRWRERGNDLCSARSPLACLELQVLTSQDGCRA